GAVLGLVTVLLWALWAVFALSVVVEVAAQLRRRRRRRRAGEVPPAADGDRPRRLGGPVQGLARYLVGSLMMSAAPVLTLGRALPAGAATPATTAVEVEAPAEAAAVVEVVDVVDDTGPDRPAAPEVVIVERGDTAWSLAERHLGDGARWREIWEANRDRAQPDGRTWADPGEDVRPGWVLHLPTGGAGAAEPALPAAADPAPAEAGPPQALAGRPGAVPSEVVVQPGDNFWDLAEGQLAAAWGRAPADGEVVDHWQALIEANRDALVRPGDPDLIHPGQVFRVPTPPPDPVASQALAGAAAGEPTPAPDAPDCDPADVGEAPATPPVAPEDDEPGPADHEPAPGEDEPADDEPAPAEDEPAEDDAETGGVLGPGPAGPDGTPDGPGGGPAPGGPTPGGPDDRAAGTPDETAAEPDPDEAGDRPGRPPPGRTGACRSGSSAAAWRWPARSCCWSGGAGPSSATAGGATCRPRPPRPSAPPSSSCAGAPTCPAPASSTRPCERRRPGPGPPACPAWPGPRPAAPRSCWSSTSRRRPRRGSPPSTPSAGSPPRPPTTSPRPAPPPRRPCRPSC